MPVLELDVLLVQQAPVRSHGAGLVADQAQGPDGQRDRRFLFVILQNHPDRAQVVRDGAPGLQLLLGCRRLGEDGLGARADDRRVDRLDQQGAEKQGAEAEKSLAAEHRSRCGNGGGRNLSDSVVHSSRAILVQYRPARRPTVRRRAHRDGS